MTPDPKPDPWRDLDAVTDADACGPWHDAGAGGRPASDPWDQLEGRLDPAEAERQLERVAEDLARQLPADEADRPDPARRRPQSQ